MFRVCHFCWGTVGCSSFLKFSDFVETELNQSAELYHRLVQLKMQQLQLTPGVERVCLWGHGKDVLLVVPVCFYCFCLLRQFFNPIFHATEVGACGREDWLESFAH